MKRNYGVIFKYYKNDTDYTQLHFEVEVVYKGQSQFGKHIFSIDKKKIFIDEKAPDLILEQFAEKAGSCLYPMDIITSDEGPFEEILNYEDVKSRWNSAKKDLEDYYKGKIAEDMIANIDEMYLNQEKLNSTVSKDLFLTLFFMPIYRKHTNRIAEYEKKITFLSVKKTVDYSILQQVDEYLTATKKQVIRLAGNSEKAKSSQPELEFDYKIDNETKSIYSIKGTIDLKQLRSSIQKIEVQMYLLHAK